MAKFSEEPILEVLKSPGTIELVPQTCHRQAIGEDGQPEEDEEGNPIMVPCIDFGVVPLDAVIAATGVYVREGKDGKPVTGTGFRLALRSDARVPAVEAAEVLHPSIRRQAGDKYESQRKGNFKLLFRPGGGRSANIWVTAEVASDGTKG